MLTHLLIQNYALIQNLELDFYSGLNIITGETGAGKSILLGAIGLIQGKRADSSCIMQGKDKCMVEAHFSIGKYRLQDFFAEEDIDYSDDLIVRRQVNSAGKSRAFINDVPVTLTQLRSLSERVIDVHSQHANLFLQEASFQLDVLDSFAHNHESLIAYRTQFTKWHRICSQIASLQQEQEQAQEQMDYLRFQQEELHAAALREGELEELEASQRQLANAESLGSSLGAANHALNGEFDGSATSALRGTLSALRSVGNLMLECIELVERIDSLSIELADIASEVERLFERIQVNPQELARVEDRLSILYHLLTKYRCQSVEELLVEQERIDKAILSVDSRDDDLTNLRLHEERERAQLMEMAESLRAARQKAQQELSSRVVAMLKQLGIEHAVFETEMRPLEKPTSTGCDEVHFLFCANRQQKPEPLVKVASGGEMSRIMLALKQIVAQSQARPTIIFDEIDSGVSGLVATQMGHILSLLAKDMQVINITHLPQIAAQGDRHFVVYKEHGSEQTLSHIRLLTQDERVLEIAKMLSGDELSEVAILNAKELLGLKA